MTKEQAAQLVLQDFPGRLLNDQQFTHFIEGRLVTCFLVIISDADKSNTFIVRSDTEQIFSATDFWLTYARLSLL